MLKSSKAGSVRSNDDDGLVRLFLLIWRGSKVGATRRIFIKLPLSTTC